MQQRPALEAAAAGGAIGAACSMLLWRSSLRITSMLSWHGQHSPVLFYNSHVREHIETQHLPERIGDSQLAASLVSRRSDQPHAIIQHSTSPPPSSQQLPPPLCRAFQHACTFWAENWD